MSKDHNGIRGIELGRFSAAAPAGSMPQALEAGSFAANKGSDISDQQADKAWKRSSSGFATCLKASQSRTCSRSAMKTSITLKRVPHASRRLRRCARTRRTRKQKSSVADEDWNLRKRNFSRRLACRQQRAPCPCWSNSGGFPMLRIPRAHAKEIGDRAAGRLHHSRNCAASPIIRNPDPDVEALCFQASGDSDRGELRCDETNIESFWASGSCFSRTAVVRSVEASAGWHFREVAGGTKLVDDATAAIVMSRGRERLIFEEGSCRTWMRW